MPASAIKFRFTIRLAALVILLASALLANAWIATSKTKPAADPIRGASLVTTSLGVVQVKDEGLRSGPALLLIHGYACSMRWWDRLAPLLVSDRRVIRLDLLGHGGSEMPASGYRIEEQAAAVAEVLKELGVSDATVAGHSLGGSVAVALAEQSAVAQRIAILGTSAHPGNAKLNAVANTIYLPVVGPFAKSLLGILPGFVARSQFSLAFAPGFDLSLAFEDPDGLARDLNRMTYTAFERSKAHYIGFGEGLPLEKRLTRLARPVLVIFGNEERVAAGWDDDLARYRTVPGARVELLNGIGHSPQLEAPEATAKLIRELSAGVSPSLL